MSFRHPECGMSAALLSESPTFSKSPCSHTITDPDATSQKLTQILPLGLCHYG
jgi:hypothetical protein